MNSLKLHKQIYSLCALKEVISAFENLCKVQIEEHNDYFICTFFDCKFGLDRTKKEFENYMIGLTNKNAF